MTASSDAIARAVAHLQAGGVVCMPTETTYGLAVDAQDPLALSRLVQLKGRAPSSPFGLIAGDAGQARDLAASWPSLADTLAEMYWPGPLTLVVPARHGLPVEITGAPALDGWGAEGGVGVRVSSHPIAGALARGLGRPITATSANPTGQPAACDESQARAYFADSALYMDETSPASAGQGASTVVAIAADGRSRVLRPGPIDVASAIASHRGR